MKKRSARMPGQAGLEEHQLVVLKVTKFDEFKRPVAAEIMYEGDVAQLSREDPTHFVTAWVPSKAVRVKVKGLA